MMEMGLMKSQCYSSYLLLKVLRLALLKEIESVRFRLVPLLYGSQAYLNLAQTDTELNFHILFIYNCRRQNMNVESRYYLLLRNLRFAVYLIDS